MNLPKTLLSGMNKGEIIAATPVPTLWLLYSKKAAVIQSIWLFRDDLLAKRCEEALAPEIVHECLRSMVRISSLNKNIIMFQIGSS